MKTKPPLSRRLYLAFGVAILVLLGLGATSYRDVVESAASDRWVRHTQEVLENLEYLSSAMSRVESSYRGYVLTGEESYAGSFAADMLIAQQSEATVGSLTQDNRLQQNRMPDLERLAAANFHFGEMVINLRRARGFDAAADTIRSQADQRVMDEFQTLVRSMENEERRLLEQRIADGKQRLKQTKTVLSLGTLLGVLVAVGAGWTVRRDGAARDLAEEALRKGIGESRAAEEHLAHMESRYRGLLEAAPDAMVVVNQGGEIVLVNVQTEKQFGYRRDELIGQKVKNIIPEGFAERLIADATRSVAEALAQQIGTGIELSGRRKDGSDFPIEIMLSPLESAEGTLVTAAIRNISVRKAAEEHLGQMEDKRRLAEDALRESEERYRMLLDGVEDYAIFMMDPRGQIVSWNAGAQRIKGYRADEIIGHNFSCFFPPEEIEQGRPEEVLRLTAALGRHEEQCMRVRKDGSRFLASLTFRALHDRAGNLRGFSEFSHDLSESKESEARYRGLLEAAPDAMVVVNQDEEIVLLNVQAEKQFGYRRDELVGQKVKNIIPRGFAERLIADGNRSAADALAQQIGTGIELSGRRKDGSEFPIEIMLSPLESAEGILVTAAIRNISARKKSERVTTQLENKATYLEGARDELELRVEERTKELAVANQVLEQSNLELKQFAYIASHDLQSPLRSISGFVQLLKLEYAGKLDEQAQDWIRRTVQATVRMETLIRDLLSYSRVDARSRPFARIPFLDIVNDALILLESSIHDSGAQVTWDSLPEIVGDRSQLVQLIQNLIGNGLKYHGDKPPRIHLSATHSGKEWIFSVRDNGIGIDPEYYEEIFEIFKRLHNDKDYPGTGIGLAVCRRVVNRHGGRIWVKSEPGSGSTFQFTIPERTEQTNAH